MCVWQDCYTNFRQIIQAQFIMIKDISERRTINSNGDCVAAYQVMNRREHQTHTPASLSGNYITSMKMMPIYISTATYKH